MSEEKGVEEIIRRFAPDLTVRRQVPAKALTTFGLGGAAAIVLAPKTIPALAALIAQFSADEVRYRILGAGSNVVFPDAGVPYPIICLDREFSGCCLVKDENVMELELSVLERLREQRTPLGEISEPESDKKLSFLVFGGTSLMSLAAHCCNKGLSGLEFASGIPGSVGGAVRMNAGAHGESMSGVVHAVYLLSTEGKLTAKKASELDFGYRRSSITGEVVVGAQFGLRPGKKEETVALRRRLLDIRAASQPLDLPSAGSVFRNPEACDVLTIQRELQLKVPPSAGLLLEQAGCKGFRIGGVAFSEKHANWLVRVSEQASTNDAIELIKQGVQAVQSKFGVTLKPEVVFW